jgi:hypothetical protein
VAIHPTFPWRPNQQSEMVTFRPELG